MTEDFKNYQRPKESGWLGTAVATVILLAVAALVVLVCLWAVVSTAQFLFSVTPTEAARAPSAAVVDSKPTQHTDAEVRWILASYGYTVRTDAQLQRAVRHWQRVNGLLVDGVVGPVTWGSLTAAVPATASAPAKRVNPPAPPPVFAGDAESIIRDVWPDDIEWWAVAIATRESNLNPSVHNACCYGLFQVYFMAHRAWLAQFGVNSPSDLYDARTNATVALAMFQASGVHPWDCHGQCKDIPL